MTGLDNGLRRVVEGNQWSVFASVLRDLTREASGIRKGKVLLAHPAIDVARVRETARRTVIELVGDTIGELLAQALEATHSGVPSSKFQVPSFEEGATADPR